MTGTEAHTALLDTLRAELTRALDGAKATYAAATDPDSRAENKYDTRTLEASYLARGQSRRVTEIQEALAACAALTPPRDPQTAAPGVLVTVRGPAGEDRYLLAPAAGGTVLPHAAGDIAVITPVSPLGRLLVGRRAGESFSVRPGGPALTLIGIR